MKNVVVPEPTVYHLLHQQTYHYVGPGHIHQATCDPQSNTTSVPVKE